MNPKIEDYLYKKIAEVILYSYDRDFDSKPLKEKYDLKLNEQELINKFSANNVDFNKLLEQLFNLLKTASNDKQLTSKAKNNTYYFIYSLLKEYPNLTTKKENDKIIINYYQEILAILNDPENTQNGDAYYKNQAQIRMIDLYWYDENENHLRESLYNDLMVLKTHLLDSETDFLKFIKSFNNDPMYYESLLAILIECPLIYQDETFKKRALTIIKYNKSLKGIFDSTNGFGNMIKIDSKNYKTKRYYLESELNARNN